MSDYFEHIEESRQKQLEEAKKRIEVLELALSTEVFHNLSSKGFNANQQKYYKKRAIEQAEQTLTRKTNKKKAIAQAEKEGE